jgi:hypothetical protein
VACEACCDLLLLNSIQEATQRQSGGVYERHWWQSFSEFQPVVASCVSTCAWLAVSLTVAVQKHYNTIATAAHPAAGASWNRP